MFILSQDKEWLVNMGMINTISIRRSGETEFTIHAWSDGELSNTTILGAYGTKERCKEIIREIYEIYGSYIYKPFSQAVLKGSHDLPEVFFNQPKCYEMPQE